MNSKLSPTRMENWYTTRERYPDEAGAQLIGDIPRADGSVRTVLTSPIVKVEGRLVRTRSGTWYELGTAHPDFVEYLRSHDYQFDPENPIRTVKKLTVLPDPNAN